MICMLERTGGTQGNPGLMCRMTSLIFIKSHRNEEVNHRGKLDTAGPVINKPGVYIKLLREKAQSMVGNYQQATCQSEPVSLLKSLISSSS